MILPRSSAYERNSARVEIVPIQPPPEIFFDDPLPASDPDFADFAERFRVICDLLDQGPPKSAAIRIAALRRILGYDRSSFRQKTRELNCSPSTLHAAVKAILQGMKSNSF